MASCKPADRAKGELLEAHGSSRGYYTRVWPKYSCGTAIMFQQPAKSIITAHTHRHVRRDEVLPGGLLAPFWGRRNSISAQDVADRLVRNAMSEIGQSTNDAVVAPAGVLSSHADNQSLDLRRDRRTTWIGTAFGAVKLLSNQSPIPSQNRVWERDGGDRLQVFSAN